MGPHIHKKIGTQVPMLGGPHVHMTPANCGLYKGNKVLKVSLVVMETKSTVPKAHNDSIYLYENLIEYSTVKFD